MAGEWTTLPLEDCMAAIIDYRGKSPEKTTFGVPLVTAKIVKGGRIEKPEEFIAEADFEDWMRRGMPEPGDIVMTTEAPLGEVAQLDGRKVALAQRVITLRGKPDVLDNTFLKFLLQSNPVQEELRSRGTGTTVVGIRQSELRKISLTLPPLAEQKAIAAVLGALDDKIELNRRMNATLEAMARALFQSWFVDFDPVRAKLDGRKPVGMDSATAALFPDQFHESELGQIPSGWHIGRIRDEVEDVFDGPHATPSESAEGPVFLGIKNLTGAALDLTKINHISESDWPRWTRRVTPRHLDIVFSYEATLGFFALIPPHLRCCLGRRLALIRTKSSHGYPHFWFHQFVGTDFQRYLIQHSVQGATVDRVPLIQFPNYRVLSPPQNIKAAFEERAAPLWSKIHANNSQSQTLITLRDTLLPKLLSGELSASKTKIRSTHD